MQRAPLVVSVGDPGGVGPMVAVRAAVHMLASERCVLFGDAAQLTELARSQGIDDEQVLELDPDELGALPHGALGVVDTGRIEPAVIARHAASAEAGEAQLRTLDWAARAVRAGQGRALVTGPTSKAAISSAGHDFVGQTEFLARLSGLHDDAVTMMFLGPRLRVALVTTHLAIAAAPRQITAPRVQRTVLHLAEALIRLYPDRARSLVVAGLNPHAGEGGLFGREELDVIGPALTSLQAREPFCSGAVVLSGPSPAEAVFRAAQRGDLDGVVAMVHDQATIASKLLDWGSAVNTTWGLPFVRTSVDHGVAYDAARTGKAEAEGMIAALEMALRLTEAAHEHTGNP